MDRIECMEAFIAVAELRGFSAAARRLELSGPKLTRLIAALETQLSVQLLRRTTRAVSLTEAGARYLPRARSIVNLMRETEASAHAEHPSPSGHFRVTAPLVFGRREVAPLFSKFLCLHRSVVGELVLVDRVVNLVEEGVDLAVRIGSLPDSSLRVRALGATRTVLVASPAYLAAHGRPRKPKDLVAHATIHVSGLSPRGVWRFSRAGKITRFTLRPSLISNSADAAIVHAVQGGGLAMVLAYQVASLVERGELEVLLPGFEPPPRPIQLVYPDTRTPSANVRAFVDFAAKTVSWRFLGSA